MRVDESSKRFDFTTVERLEALTDEENVAEHKALERAGFRREGALRCSYFHRGSCGTTWCTP